MALHRLLMVLLIVALAVVAESTTFHNVEWGTLTGLAMGSRKADGLGRCNGKVGDCINVEEEMMMDSESTRRVLAGKKYISYGAMRANSVPCGYRGRSYYNCKRMRRANPYRRGCSAITRCKRYTD